MAGGVGLEPGRRVAARVHRDRDQRDLLADAVAELLLDPGDDGREHRADGGAGGEDEAHHHRLSGLEERADRDRLPVLVDELDVRNLDAGAGVGGGRGVGGGAGTVAGRGVLAPGRSGQEEGGERRGKKECMEAIWMSSRNARWAPLAALPSGGGLDEDSPERQLVRLHLLGGDGDEEVVGARLRGDDPRLVDAVAHLDRGRLLPRAAGRGAEQSTRTSPRPSARLAAARVEQPEAHRNGGALRRPQREVDELGGQRRDRPCCSAGLSCASAEKQWRMRGLSRRKATSYCPATGTRTLPE